MKGLCGPMILGCLLCLAQIRADSVIGALFENAADDWALFVQPSPKGDLTVETDIVWKPTGKSARAGVMFTHKDPKNYAICALTREPYKAWNGPQEEDLHTIAIYQVVDGKEEVTNVCPWQHPSEGTHRMKVVVAGKQVLAYLGGKPVLQGGIVQSLAGGNAGVAARYYAAEFGPLKVTQTPAGTELYGIGNVHHDKSGAVVPRWPYKDMVTRPMEFMFWAADNALGNWLRDEDGKKWPPYVYAVTINLTGTVGTPTMYVLQEFSFFNNGLLDYYMFTGDKRALDRAKELADWLTAPAHLIPADWPCGGMSATKTNLGKVVGDVEGKTIFLWPYGDVGDVKDEQTGGDLISLEEQGAGAYTVLRLFHLTGDKSYLGYCTGVADALLRVQLPEGNWHYRVNPRTGEPNDDFTANVVDNIIFLDEMAETTGKRDYAAAARKAEQWLLNVPVKNNRWLGIFGDVPSNVHLEWAGNYKGKEPQNYSGFVAMNAARHLLAQRDKHPEYVKLAQGLRKWIFDGFLGKDSNGLAGIAEQTVCYHVMPYHGFHQSMVEADLYEATGRTEYNKMGLHFLNAGMYQTEVNGFILLMGGGTMQGKADTWWCNITWAPTAYVYAMGTWPEMAPKGENHLVRVSAPLTNVQYTSNGVRYGTARASSDRLIVASRPKSIACDGKSLPELKDTGKGHGWTYDPKTGSLKISHPAGEVKVEIRGA